MIYNGIQYECSTCKKAWTITDQAINEYNQHGDWATNREFLQFRYCPYCRNTSVAIQKFRYETDEHGRCTKTWTEEEYRAEMQRK